MGRGDSASAQQGEAWYPWDQLPRETGYIHDLQEQGQNERALLVPERPDQPSGCCVLGFDWSLHFQWEQLSPEQKAQRLDPSEPIR